MKKNRHLVRSKNRDIPVKLDAARANLMNYEMLMMTWKNENNYTSVNENIFTYISLVKKSYIIIF
jgi:hypothetical protein